jgi:hypothetical protein
MQELIDHIKELNTLKKLVGDYFFYSTQAAFWQEQKVSTVAQFEHWQAKTEYETEFRRQGNKGFLPLDPDAQSVQELHTALEHLKESPNGKL